MAGPPDGAVLTPRGGSSGRRIAGAAALIAALTVASRVVGFGRTVAFTTIVTPNDLGDIYAAANLVPNIIFEIVAGGALASMVVPLLAGAVARNDRREVSATTSALLTWTLCLLVPLALLVVLLAGPIIAVLAADASPAQLAVGERMLRIFAWQLPLYGVGIVLTGVLHAHRRFAWPVLAPLLSSVTVIGVYLTFAVVAGRGVDIAELSRTGELVLSVGTTLGVAVLSLSLLIPLWRMGLRVRPALRFVAAARRRVGGLALAGGVTVLGQQITLVVAVRLALDGPDGSVVLYQQAQAFFLLPWAVLAVPVATAAYPTLAAAGSARDAPRYAAALAPATRAVLLLSALGAAALVAVAQPLAGLLVDGDDVGRLAAGIAGFAPGLVGYGLFAVLSRALYARGDTTAAAVATGAGWSAAALAAVLLATGFAAGTRVGALALANSVGMTVLGGVLLVVLARRAGRVALAGVGRAGAVGLVAGGLAAVAGWGVATAVGPGSGGPVVQGMLAGVAVAVVFFAVAYPLDRGDLRRIVTIVARRGRRDQQEEGTAG